MTIHDTQIYWTRVCTLKEIQYSEMHTMSIQEKKICQPNFKMYLVFTSVLCKLYPALPSSSAPVQG